MSRADKHREASSTGSVQQPKQQKQTKQPKQPLMQRIKEMKTGYKVAALVVIILLLAVIIVGAVVWNYMNRVVDEMHETLMEEGAGYLGELYGLWQVSYSYSEEASLNKFIIYWFYE